MRLLAFGDSITYGSWDTEGGWVERLKKRAHAATVVSAGNYKMQIINLGIGGNTSTALLARMESEIESRLSANWPLIIVISVGTNDGRTLNGAPEVTIEQYERNIQALIVLAKRYTDRVLVVGLPPLGAEVLDFKGWVYSDESIKNYNAVLQREATRHGVMFANMRALFENSESKALFCYDSLHPSDEGHELIARSVGLHLSEMGVSFKS